MKEELRISIIKALAEEDDKKYTTEEWQGALLFCANLIGTTVETLLSYINSFQNSEQEYLETMEQEIENQFLFQADYESRQEEYYMEKQYSGLNSRYDD